MTGRPAAADKSLPRRGCQAESRATLCPEGPPPTMCCLGEEEQFDGYVSGDLHTVF